MKQFLVFVRKEFLHIVRDPLTMAILLGLPILMLSLFGFAITTEVKNTRMVVYDPSRDGSSRALVERLSHSGWFVHEGMLDDPRLIEGVFREGKAGLVVAFPPHFEQSLLHDGKAQVQFIADGTDPNTAVTMVQYASAIAASWQASQIREGGAAPFRIVPEVKLLYNPAMKGAYNFVPGVMGMILLLICAMMTSISIAREKEKGTMEILLASPMRPGLVIAAKVVPYFVLSCVNLTTVLLLSVFVLEVPVAGSLAALVVFSLLYITVALALGILISSIVKTQLVALLISGMALMAPIILLSGMVFPVENMPVALQALSNIIPARWYIVGVKKVMIKGLGFSSLVQEFVILAGMALFFLAVSVKKFRNRLD